MEKLKYKNTRTSKKTRSAAPKKDVKKEKNTKVKKQNINNNKNNKTVIKVDIPKKSKINKKKLSKNKISIICLIIVFILLAITCTLMLTLPYFNVKGFKVNGAKKYSGEEIIQKLELEPGKNIFIEIFSGVGNKLNELPYIKEVKMSIIWPNEVEVKIVERESFFFTFDKDTNKFYKIDEEGYILEESQINQRQETELLTYGFIFDDEVKFGSRLKEVDISKISIYNHIKEQFDKSGINGSITKVNFENSLTTITLNDKLNVIFPNDTDVEYKMIFFKSILDKIGEDSVGVIDMTKTDPVFSSF